MTTFFLLPPRTACARAFAEFWGSWFPGTPVPAPDSWAALAEARAGVFVVFADDLLDPDRTEAELRDAFGAEPGDRAVDLRDVTDPGGTARCWMISPAPPASDSAMLLVGTEPNSTSHAA